MSYHSLIRHCMFHISIEKHDFDRLSICGELFPRAVWENDESAAIRKHFLYLTEAWVCKQAGHGLCSVAPGTSVKMMDYLAVWMCEVVLFLLCLSSSSSVGDGVSQRSIIVPLSCNQSVRSSRWTVLMFEAHTVFHWLGVRSLSKLGLNWCLHITQQQYLWIKKFIT